MKEKMDLKYLCVTIGNLSGIPVRIFDREQQVCYHSIVLLPKDPFLPYREEIFAIENHVGYFATPHEYYFGIVRFGENRLVVGPTRPFPVSDQELREIAFEHGVPNHEVKTFVEGMRNIAPVPLMRLLQTLTLLNHFLNDGETLSLPDITIYHSEQETLQQKVAEEVAKRSLATEGKDNPMPHNTLDLEAFMVNAIRRGDVAGLKAFFAKVPAIRGGVIAENELRQAKNTFIVSSTLFSRAAIQGGMSAEDALTLSDIYIQKCERLTTGEEVINLNYRLIMDYAERMEQLLYGNPESKLVIEVNNYLRHHLSEPITVENIARHLSRGRSRLSTDFKKQTGENLSDYIMRQKIEEGKKLLLYTNKSAVEIALYLGFSSQSHFSRTFKKYVEKTPNEYRRGQNSKDE